MASGGGAAAPAGGSEKRHLLGGIYHRSSRKEPLGEGSFAKVRETLYKRPFEPRGASLDDEWGAAETSAAHAHGHRRGLCFQITSLRCFICVLGVTAADWLSLPLFWPPSRMCFRQLFGTLSGRFSHEGGSSNPSSLTISPCSSAQALSHTPRVASWQACECMPTIFEFSLHLTASVVSIVTSLAEVDDEA
jgi:hypothetical protein